MSSAVPGFSTFHAARLPTHPLVADDKIPYDFRIAFSDEAKACRPTRSASYCQMMKTLPQPHEHRYFFLAFCLHCKMISSPGQRKGNVGEKIAQKMVSHYGIFRSRYDDAMSG